VIAFGGLIAYHLSELYAKIPWDAGSAGQPAMALFHAALSPWRMGLLFIVSGMVTRFLADHRTPEALWLHRCPRLLLPVLFGVVFLIPPEVYLLLTAKRGYDESFPVFLTHYFSLPHTVVMNKVTYVLPLFLHLWYLAYLALYTLLLAALLKYAPGAVRRLEQIVARRAAGPGLLAWPLLFLVLLRTLLYPLASPDNLMDEVYRNTAFFGLFVFGFLVGRCEPVWDALVRYRWLALAMAAAGFAVFGYYAVIEGQGDGALAEARHPVLHLIRPMEVWGAICAIFGFGRLYLRGGGPVLRYLSRGVLTFYVLHHPVMLATAVLLGPARLHPPVEAAVVLAATSAACVGAYELIRRCAPRLRRWRASGLGHRGVA
jgi:surface polysaccharide O-acyltransferase-like enzyme